MAERAPRAQQWTLPRWNAPSASRSAPKTASSRCVALCTRMARPCGWRRVVSGPTRATPIEGGWIARTAAAPAAAAAAAAASRCCRRVCLLLHLCRRRRPAASNSAPTGQTQEQATAYLNQLSGSPEGWKFCVDRFTPTAYAEVKFWCLRTLHEVRGRAPAVPARRLATCRCMLAPASSCGRCYVQQRGFRALPCSCFLDLTHAALPYYLGCARLLHPAGLADAVSGECVPPVTQQQSQQQRPAAAALLPSPRPKCACSCSRHPLPAAPLARSSDQGCAADLAAARLHDRGGGRAAAFPAQQAGAGARRFQVTACFRCWVSALLNTISSCWALALCAPVLSSILFVLPQPPGPGLS